MRVFDYVVLALGARRVARETAASAQRREVGAASKKLVDVRLMARVEHDCVVGRLKHAMQTDRQFDNTEIWPKVPTSARDGVHEVFADFASEFLALRR